MSNLTSLYDQIRAGDQPTINRSQLSMNDTVWRTNLRSEGNKLKEDCAKKIILDVYCKILPFDTNYIQGNQGELKQDVDTFLKNKDMTAMQYLQSCGESTKSPFIEKFLIPAIGKIGRIFIEEANEKLKDAKEKDINISTPTANADSEEVSSQIVEIEDDNEYDGFISTLKKKTIDKIIKDVSDIINKKKEEKNMTFDLKNESVITIIMDHMTTKLMKENIDIDDKLREEMLGVAIKEAAFNVIDENLKQPGSDLRNLSNRIRFNKGVLITESTINTLKEKGKLISTS